MITKAIVQSTATLPELRHEAGQLPVEQRRHARDPAGVREGRVKGVPGDINTIDKKLGTIDCTIKVAPFHCSTGRGAPASSPRSATHSTNPEATTTSSITTRAASE